MGGGGEDQIPRKYFRQPRNPNNGVNRHGL